MIAAILGWLKGKDPEPWHEPIIDDDPNVECGSQFTPEERAFMLSVGDN